MQSLKLFIRHFQKQKTTGFLSIASLALGITVALITGLWCLNESSFDSFHPQAENTYRITRKGFINGESVSLGAVCNPAGPEIKEKLPEVTEVTRIYPLDGFLKVGNRTDGVENVYAADANYHQLLSFPLVQGRIEDFENKPNAIIINEDWAQRYFPHQNPIGEIVDFKGDKEVVGVMKNMPINTSFNIEAFIRIDAVTYLKNAKWGGNDSFITFVKLVEDANVTRLESIITAHALEKFEPYKAIEIKFQLQPLTDIHLGHKYRFDYTKHQSKSLVISFGIMALIILLIGCINFTNLFISNSFLRAKSIGVKKANGATKAQLVFDFISETFIYSLTATIFAVLLAELFTPLFGQIIGYELNIDFTAPITYLVLLALISFSTVMAGIFPAVYMTHFNPVQTLKDQFKGNKVSVVQKSLIIFQFAASIALLIGTITIKKQVDHLQSMNLGFSKENVIYFEMNKSFRDNYDRYAKEIKAFPDVTNVTAKGCSPLDWNQGSSVKRIDNLDNECLMEVCYIKPNYFDMMEMPLVQGANPFGVNDSLNYCVVNEAAAKILGEQSIIGQQVSTTFRGDYIVKGVVKNAYTKSLHQKVDPQVYLSIPDKKYGLVMVKVRHNPKAVITQLQTMWDETTPSYPFTYHFLDSAYEDLYRSEEVASQIANWLMLIAFVISIAGLFGIVRYSINRRTKEIGVRKVNGATLSEIIALLNSTYVKWVGLSFVIACPFAWYLMNKWLSDFAVKTEMSWWIFIVTGLIAMTITVITVSIQAYKAASQNPVKALRYE
ncbi:ABC transporter permease [Carboxylicivirga sp. A043]|uniref:ABC transporter permease n=1 Tax=Carboxylicivirga litoralis TaxID=2816963 RepID=UPI0021CB3F18|nr:ABC transporter permease [Carboxylicivirga sp. A043]MCU4156525.1 ABC transporter permease [Carboxylicivirga sp. A043]